MKIWIKTFARFREVFGDRFTVEVPLDATVLQVAKTVECMHDGGRGMLMESDHTIRRSVILLRNGRRIPGEGREQVRLSEGDELTIYPPVAGG
jgi:molybdopterin synthase sulfur carrier subunit